MTDIEKTRLLTGDKTLPHHFTDEEIQAFLSMGGSVYLAAALALESWAGSLSEQMESEHIGDYSYTRKQVDNKLKLAQRYRENDAAAPAMDWASFDLVNYGEAE